MASDAPRGNANKTSYSAARVARVQAPSFRGRRFTRERYLGRVPDDHVLRRQRKLLICAFRWTCFGVPTRAHDEIAFGFHVACAHAFLCCGEIAAQPQLLIHQVPQNLCAHDGDARCPRSRQALLVDSGGGSDEGREENAQGVGADDGRRRGAATICGDARVF